MGRHHENLTSRAPTAVHTDLEPPSAPRRSRKRDGTYKISGQKIWISSGEHDLTENIVPPGPGADRGRAGRHPRHQPVHRARDFLPDKDGNPGHPFGNSVKCLGLEEKMGIHGSNATCL